MILHIVAIWLLLALGLLVGYLASEELDRNPHRGSTRPLNVPTRAILLVMLPALLVLLALFTVVERRRASAWEELTWLLSLIWRGTEP